MTDDDDDLEVWVDEDVLEGADPPKRRRRRPRMGEVIDRLGAGARVHPGEPGKVVEARARAEMSKRLEQGGKNRGEQKGYGLAKHQKPPPEP